MKNKGIVLLGEDTAIEGRAKKAGLGLVIDTDRPFQFEKTLFVEPGTQIPWDLLPAAWHFLERWDAAVPLWRYGMNAEDIGTPEERKATKAIIRDLRVLLHSVELLFVRRNETGSLLLETWKQEMDGGDKRLAFLRALYQVKPRLCVLPTSWLADVRHQSQQAWLRGRVRSINAGQPLVKIEIEPGRWVKCHKGDEEKVLEQFARQRGAQ